MSNKIRLIIWGIFAAVSITIALVNRGWHETKWMLLAFFIIGVAYEIILYFQIKKRLKK